MGTPGTSVRLQRGVEWATRERSGRWMVGRASRSLGVSSIPGIRCLEIGGGQEGESERWLLVSASGPTRMEKEGRESLGKKTSCECLGASGRQGPAGTYIIWSGAPERSWRGSVLRM